MDDKSIHETPLELYATDDITSEELNDAVAGGLSTGSSVSSGGTVTGTFSSFGSLSTLN